MNSFRKNTKHPFFLLWATFFASAFLAAQVLPCWALEWKQLNDESLSVSLAEVRAEVQTFPDSLEKIYILGIKNLENYRIEDAKKNFAAILQKDPSSIEARWGMAEVLRLQHKREESKKLLKEILNEDPRFAPALNSLGYLKYLDLSFNEAIRLFGKVINLGRKRIGTKSFVRAHALYGATKGMMAHYAGSFMKPIHGMAVAKHLKIAERILPDSVDVNFGWGNYYMLVPKAFGNDIEKSEEYLKKTIRLSPQFPDPYVRLAQIYLKKGDKKKYDQLLAQALALDPQNELAVDIRSRKCKYICLENAE